MFKPYYKDNNGNLQILGLHVEKSDVSTKLGTQNIGSENEPIYLKEGSPQKCSTLKESIINLIYPVGSIYLSVNAVDPQNLFGGKWEQIKDKFLLGAGATYSNGSSGGEATHILTVNEMPSHTHRLWSQNEWSATVVGINRNTAYGVGAVEKTQTCSYTNSQGSDSHQIVENTGSGKAHNNMPPYIAVNIWKRIS